MKTTSSTRRLLGISIPCAVLALLLSSAPAGIVTNTNDSGPGSLRQAIDDASSGETITFDDTLSGGTIVLSSGQLTVDKDLDIDASGLVEGITIDANYTSRVFEFASGTSTLKGVNLVKGSAPSVEQDHEPGDLPQSRSNGGGIFNRSTLTLDDCMLADNRAWGKGEGVGVGFGGGIANEGTLTVNNSDLNSNSADFGGGICDSVGFGGGIANEGTLTINNSDLNSNSADLGGGICNWSGNARIKNCILSRNSAYDSCFEGGGGEIYAIGGTGGGIYDSGSTYVYNCILKDNWAESAGGGICGRWYSIRNCTLVGNSAKKGGACSGGSWVTNCILSGNSAQQGGGLFGRPRPNCPWPLVCSNGTVLGNCLFYSNTAPSDADWNVGLYAYNILTSDPLFVSPDDFRLQPGSPCIDAGTPVDGLIDDIEGTPRPLDGDNDGTARIDIGAYEFINPAADSDADGLSDGDELDTLGTNPTLLNTDGDPRNDYEEWLADTDGTDPSDWFRIDGSKQGKWMVIRFITSPNRHYTLRRCEDLGEGIWSDEPGFVRIRGRGCPHTFFVRRPASPACFWMVEPGVP